MAHRVAPPAKVPFAHEISSDQASPDRPSVKFRTPREVEGFAEYPDMDGIKLRILLIDDEQPHIELIIAAFEARPQQFSLISAGSLFQARALLADFKPDVIIADLVLPDGEGTEIIGGGGVQAEFPVIILTGRGDEAAAVSAMKSGALDYVVKTPESLQGLPHITERALVQWRLKLQRDQALQELRKSEERFRDLLESAPDAMLIVDSQATIRLLNKQSEVLFGYARQEMIGQPVELLVPEALREGHVKKRNAYLSQPVVTTLNCEVDHLARRKDGSEVPVDVGLSPLHAADGLLIVAAVRDITARREMEQKVQRAQRLASVATLAAGIAHEMNNPITAAWTAAESALKLNGDPNSGDLFAESMQTVINSVRRCDQMIRNMLRFSRNQVSEKSPRDINQVVREAWQMTQVRAEASHARVVLELSDELPLAAINPVEIGQVMVNLLHNAMEAGAKEPEITIRTFSGVGMVGFSVEDRGKGISDAEKASIFDPFYTTRADGVGLGLSVSYQIIQQHGGSIAVKSQKGKGTTMTVHLPVADASTLSAAGRPGNSLDRWGNSP